MTGTDIVFFMPVFNEIRALPTLLDEVARDLPGGVELLLVDNGSSDGSERVIRRSGFPFVEIERNRGVGYANIRAVDWALERGMSIFGAITASGKMPPAQIPRLIAPLLNDEADYVTGSRFLAGGGYPNLPAFRRGSIPMVNVFVRALTGARLTDATCGFRAYRLDLMRRAQFDWHAPWLHTYGFEYYLYAKVVLDGALRWKEVPITMRYPERGTPYSKIRPGKDWIAMLRPWVRARRDGAAFARA